MNQTLASASEVRKKAKANIANFLTSLDQFDRGWDDDRHNDDGDGIKTRSANQLTAEHTARKLAMRKRFGSNQPIFTQDEVAEDASSIAVVVLEVDPNDINRRGKWGYTPLIEAAVKGDYVECQRLKDAGADLALKDNSGKLAWQKAEARGFTEIANMLKPE